MSNPPKSDNPPQNPSLQVVGAVTASVRAFVFQISQLYLRTPMKLFRPSRFDYMAYTRLALFYGEKLLELKNLNVSKNPVLQTATPRYSFFRHSSIALLWQAVRKHGWRFIPDNVLPPLLANSFTGIVLYTSYLTTLGGFDAQEKNYEIRELGRVWQPRVIDCFKAGFIAGALQSLVAAPIDAIYARSSEAELLTRKHDNLWKYGIYKLRNIGVIGVFAGFGISLLKESVGFAFYFLTFEMIKNQWFNTTYRFLNGVSRFKYQYLGFLFKGEPSDLKDQTKTYNVLKLSFILFAGASAATVLQVVQFPLTKIQKIHLSRLEFLDIYNLKVPEYRTPQYNSSRYRLIKNVESFPQFLQKAVNRINATAFFIKYWRTRIMANPFLTVYYRSYLETLTTILTIQRQKNLTWWQWSYKGFTKNVATTIPATSICLLVFEIMRSRIGGDDAVTW